MIEKLNNPIYVTQPAMPPLEEFTDLLKIIWDNKILTNNGPFHQQFEYELAEYLGVKYISVFTNGTLALMTALQSLRITGEVITTPFSFVATTHSLWWNNIKPVFADIEPDNFNLDPEKVEAAITPQTTAIMPVHVYGNPCKLERFQQIADTYGLKIIYDAAHAFGVKVKGTSVLNYGDLSILSFHATKVFNTIEGGAIICHDEKTKQRIDYLKNFGFAGETTVIAPGINAKMNELQAAYGLLQLKYVDKCIEKRKTIASTYRNQLKGINGINFLEDMDGVDHAYSYFPILVDKDKFGKTRDELYEGLKEQNIFGRRYFYPLISQFPTYRGLPSSRPDNLPVATKVAEQVIC
ncbi:MAG TPA: DegT/DnrJ/EryC1/StrS family aminotransferase, partial [Prolixibacteraceae bacterium]